MSLEIVDDIHELILQNEQLKKENDALKNELSFICKRLSEMEQKIRLFIAFNVD
jgi:cell division septum initiation protein DivIVA